jgi:hypothetical protein
VEHGERGSTVSTNMGNEKNNPSDNEACYETVAGQEEYLETTEGELRADLTCEQTTAEKLRTKRKKLELDWELEKFDERCK